MHLSPETSEAFDRLEHVVIPSVEASIREKKPLFLEPEQVEVMHEAFAEAGVNYDLAPREKESLLSAPHLRLRAKVNSIGLVTGVEIYDRTIVEETTKWRDLDPEEKFEEDPFLTDEGGNTFADKGYGLVAALGGQKTAELVKLTYNTAIETKVGGKIGGHDGTQGRGGLQHAADLLGITLIDTDYAKGYELKLKSAQAGINQRLEKSLLKANFPETYKKLLSIWSGDGEPSQEDWMEIGEEVRTMNNMFRSHSISNPVKGTSSYSPERLSGLIRFLATRNL